MENGLFSSDEFAQWSQDQVVYLHVSTRLEGREHEELFRELGFRGFPSFAFLDAEGKLTAKHAGPRTVAGLESTKAESAAYLAMREKAAGGDRSAVQHLFVKDLDLGRYGFAAATLAFAGMRADLAPALRATVEQALIDLQFDELQGDLSKQVAAGLERSEYQRRLSELHMAFFEAGLMPGQNNAVRMLTSVLRTAHEREDVELFSSAFGKLEAVTADNPRFRGTVDRFRAQLDELRGSK